LFFVSFCFVSWLISAVDGFCRMLHFSQGVFCIALYSQRLGTFARMYSNL